MIGKREFLGWIVAGAMAIGYFIIDLGPYPYTDVEVVRIEQVGNMIEFVANFEKTDCEFRRLSVVGRTLGTNDILTWSDPTRNEDPNREEDRDKGSQTLSLNIDAVSSDYTWIEVRTRHFCSDLGGSNGDVDDFGNVIRGDYFDKVFARFTPNDVS